MLTEEDIQCAEEFRKFIPYDSSEWLGAFIADWRELRTQLAAAQKRVEALMGFIRAIANSRSTRGAIISQ